MRRDAGLSLIELVVAMAIFALVAIMGAQALTGMLRMRDGVVARSEDTARLAEATSLLRADLSAAVPMLFYPPGSPYSDSAVSFRDGTLAFSTGGQPGVMTDGEDFPLTRVEWRVEDGKLLRRSYPTLIPAETVRPSPDQTILTGVSALRLRSYLPELGWTSGLRVLSAGGNSGDGGDTGAEQSSYSSALPLGLEVTLITDAYGEIPIVEAFK